MRIPIVYTMGKVASSAISNAIRATGRTVHDIHTLNDDALMREAQKALDQGRFPNPHICVSMAWKTREITVQQRCVYISLVRDPVARNISAYFQNHGNQMIRPDGSPHPAAEDLFADFVAHYPHKFPVRWYDREYRKQLQIDVYKGRFRQQAGYQLSHHERILIFKVDTSDTVKSEVLSRVLGYEVDVQRVHESNSKDYGEAYKAVREIAQFEGAFLDEIYGSQFVKHFWVDDDIEEMRARWLKPNSQI